MYLYIKNLIVYNKAGYEYYKTLSLLKQMFATCTILLNKINYSIHFLSYNIIIRLWIT